MAVPADEVVLEGVDVGETFVVHACGASGARFPCGLGGFVASDVDVFRREYLHDIGQYILEKRECLLVAHTEVGTCIGFALAG